MKTSENEKEKSSMRFSFVKHKRQIVDDMIMFPRAIAKIFMFGKAENINVIITFAIPPMSVIIKQNLNNNNIKQLLHYNK